MKYQRVESLTEKEYSSAIYRFFIDFHRFIESKI